MRRCRHDAHEAGPDQWLICAKVQVGLLQHMLVVVLQTSMTCSQEGKLTARLQNVKMCGRAHGPLLSLCTGKETWGGTSDSYFQNLRNYSLVIESPAAQFMVEASNMAALGVEVQGASIRLAKTVLIVVLTWQCAFGPLCHVMSLASS